MSRLVLHIGGVKTGTTFVQEVLFQNRGVLQENLIGTPFTNRNQFQLALVGAEKKQQPRFTQWARINESEVPEYPDRLRREIETCASQFETTYITSEFMTQSVTRLEGVRRIANIISGIFDEILIVYFVRRPELLSISLYSTAIRAGRINCFSTGEALGKNSLFQSSRAMLWREGIPNADFHTIPYIESAESSEVVRRLTLCLAPSEPDFWQKLAVPSHRTNASLTSIGLEVLRLLNMDFSGDLKCPRREMIGVVENLTSHFGKAGLTEKEYLSASQYCYSETLKIQALLNSEDKQLFLDQLPGAFAATSQTQAATLHDGLIQDLRLSVMRLLPC